MPTEIFRTSLRSIVEAMDKRSTTGFGSLIKLWLVRNLMETSRIVGYVTEFSIPVIIGVLWTIFRTSSVRAGRIMVVTNEASSFEIVSISESVLVSVRGK